MAITAVTICVLILLGGLGTLAGAIIGLCATRKKEMPRKDLVTGILIAILVLGLLMTILPISLAGFYFWIHAGEDMLIAEGGEIPDTFTADGVEYEILPLVPYFTYCSNNSELFYTYRGEFSEREYFLFDLSRVKNPQDFDLLWNECDVLYCPVDQTEAVMAYYGALEGSTWQCWCTDWAEVENWEDLVVPETQVETLESLHTLWYSGEEKQIPTNTSDLWLTLSLNDELVCNFFYTVALNDTDAYLITREEMVDSRLIQYGVSLPEDLSAAVHELASCS